MADVSSCPVATPVVVLLSGSGRTLQNLLDLQAAGELPISVRHVISSRDDAYGLVRAEKAGVARTVLRRKDAPDAATYTARVFDACRAAGAELVLCAGWLVLLRPIPDDYRGKVLNIHPALLPAFGGKGFYGDKVHAAVLSAGVAVTGCTVHLVDDEYDHGEVLLQCQVPVLPGDTVESLGHRVFDAELEAYPTAIRLWLSGRASARG